MAMRDVARLKKDAAVLSPDEQLKLAEFLISQARRRKNEGVKGDLGEFYGTIKFPEDGLAYQERVRVEWDR